MFFTSRLASASWIFVTTLALNLVKSLPQETHIRREISSNICRDEKYPSVNITSFPPIYSDGMSTTKLIETHTASVVLTCYEFYPVEWVFQQRISDDAVASIVERREWIPTENGELVQQFLIEVTLDLTNEIHNVTCRAVTEPDGCKQTTVKFARGDIHRINTTAATVYQGLSRGESLQQYSSAYDGNNRNCSLHLLYNRVDERFECYSQNNDSLVFLQKSEIFNTDLCYDSFSCGLLYNRKAIKNCEKGFHKDTYYLRTTLKHTLDRLYNFTGIVTCKTSEESQISREGNEESQIVSTSSHFFQPQYYRASENCQDYMDFDWNSRLSFYFDVDSLSLNDEDIREFIEICGLGVETILGEIYTVTCFTSVYVFAEGIQMKLKMRNGSASNVKGSTTNKVTKLTVDVCNLYNTNHVEISLLYEDNPSKIKEDGYRKYITNLRIDSTQIFGISCSAPRRKSKSWTVKAYRVEVENSEPLKFDGNISETHWVKRDAVVVLTCSASGNPLARYEWKYLVTNATLPIEWVSRPSFSSGSLLTVPSRNSSMLVINSAACVARNSFESIEKTFNFYWEIDNSSVFENSDSVATNISVKIIMVSVIVLIVLGGIFVFLVWKIVPQRRNLGLLSQVEIDEFLNGNAGLLVNPQSDCEYDINSYSASLPYNKNFEVLKEQLEIDMGTIIGSGAYGIVLKGILTTMSTEKIKVAIKTSKPMDDISYLKALMSELKIMGYIGKHDNIVNLLGAYTKNLQNKEILIATEYCDNGSMLTYLRAHRENFVDQTLQPNPNETDLNPPTNVFSTMTLLRWSMQISNGMNFLCQKKVIHGDLAARNVLLSLDLTAKVGDFGLSRQLYEYSNYIKKQQTLLPWKWLAIECHKDMKFSAQSDVWAYGITLWEMFGLGHSPFPGCSYNEEFIDSLVGGKRPVKPQYAIQEWYDLMRKCWSIKTSERPSFADISLFFDNTIRAITNEEYMNIDCLTIDSVFSADGANKTCVHKHVEDKGVLPVGNIEDEETVF